MRVTVNGLRYSRSEFGGAYAGRKKHFLSDVSSLDLALAAIGFPQGLISDITSNVTSTDPNAPASTQATLDQALADGTITGDQYNQAISQITQAAQAGTIGGNFANIGQGILSGAEGIAVVAGILGLVLLVGPQLVGHAARSTASQIRSKK